jgi:hypothetical protein
MTPADEIAIGLAIAEGIAKIWATWEAAKAGEITPDMALSQIKGMTDTLAADDAAAKAAEDEKFGPPAP